MELTIAMAPLEGITTHIFRKVYEKYFSGVDIYYTPFLSANHTHKFKTREKKEFLPYDDKLVPQILTNSAEDFLWSLEKLGAAGYKEVNLNLGCPSGTVFSKRKGAGMLFDTEALKGFFDEVFSTKEGKDLPDISVKTRIGVREPAEAEELARVYAAFTLKEVIIHPRLRSDFYKNEVDMDAFGIMYEIMRSDAKDTSIMFNGDIVSPKDVERLTERFPEIDRVMIGRGLLMNPGLPDLIKGGSVITTSEGLREFHDELYREYAEELSGERDVLFKMKELWAYWAESFPGCEREIKTIRKTKNANEYRAAVNAIFG